MNSDTILHEGCLDRSLAYLRSEERIGGLGIRTLKDDGTLDHGCKRGFPTPSASLYYFLGLDKMCIRDRKNAESVCERGRAYFQLKGSSAHGFTLEMCIRDRGCPGKDPGYRLRLSG